MKYIKKYGIVFFIVFGFFMFYKPVVCILMLGLIFSFYGIHYYTFLSSIERKGIESIGKILRYERDDENYKTPIVKFNTKKGINIEAKPYYYASTDLSKFRTYKSKINKNVTVIYEHEKPERFIIKSERSFNYLSLIFASLVGLIFLAIGIANILGYLNIVGID